jgi:hypothetical protein
MHAVGVECRVIVIRSLSERWRYHFAPTLSLASALSHLLSLQSIKALCQNSCRRRSLMSVRIMLRFFEFFLRFVFHLLILILLSIVVIGLNRIICVMLLKTLLRNVLELFAKLSVTLRRRYLLSLTSPLIPLHLWLLKHYLSIAPIIWIGCASSDHRLIPVSDDSGIALLVILLLRLRMQVNEVTILRCCSR